MIDQKKLSPKRTKYKKYHRGHLRGKASSGNKISFGSFGLQSLSSKWISAKQIIAAHLILSKYTKRGGKVWIRIFPDKPLTNRAKESRMGSGKGSIESWIAVVKPGTILFEINIQSELLAKKILNLASYKLPLKTRFITKYN